MSLPERKVTSKEIFLQFREIITITCFWSPLSSESLSTGTERNKNKYLYKKSIANAKLTAPQTGKTNLFL